MTAAAISPRQLISAAQLEHQIESGTPLPILEAQLLQLADHPQRTDTDSLCELLAVLDQQHRRSRLSREEFRQLQARLAPLIVSAGQRPAPPRAAPNLRAVPPRPPRQDAASGVEAATRPALAPGFVLRGRYELRRLLGEGGMSCVWEAVDRLRAGAQNQDGRIAVKLLRPSVAARDDAVQALHREFERAQSLSHPSIINVLDLDADGDLHFITMERLEGDLLSEVIKRLRPGHLPHAQAFAIIARLGDAVAFAHEADIVHADVKPGNVMVTDAGELRLFDFGAAWPAQREPWIYDSSERSLQGATPTYASAERLSGAAPTVRDDVFSFCCLAYELLSGKHPYDRRPAHEAAKLQLKPRRIAGLKRRQWRALARGLKFHREDRWADMPGLLTELLPPRVAQTPLPLHFSAAREPRQMRLSGLWMLLLGGAAFAIAHYANAEPPPALQWLVDTARAASGALLQLVR